MLKPQGLQGRLCLSRGLFCNYGRASLRVSSQSHLMKISLSWPCHKEGMVSDLSAGCKFRKGRAAAEIKDSLHTPIAPPAQGTDVLEMTPSPSTHTHLTPQITLPPQPHLGSHLHPQPLQPRGLVIHLLGVTGVLVSSPRSQPPSSSGEGGNSVSTCSLGLPRMLLSTLFTLQQQFLLLLSTPFEELPTCPHPTGLESSRGP